MAVNDDCCHSNPNFAVICSFISNFGDECGIGTAIPCLQRMLEDTKNVDEDLKEMHIKLLRKARKWFNKDKWEKALIKFCHEYSSIDAWELERFGYKKAKLAVKLEILKRLLELQFDCNSKFKSEVNKQDAESLRILPIGRDSNGHKYWYQVDKEYNIRLYKQNVDEESLWMLLCSTREDLEQLVSTLKGNSETGEEEKSGDTKKEIDIIPTDNAALSAEKPDKGNVTIGDNFECKENEAPKTSITDTGQNTDNPVEIKAEKKCSHPDNHDSSECQKDAIQTVCQNSNSTNQNVVSQSLSNEFLPNQCSPEGALKGLETKPVIDSSNCDVNNTLILNNTTGVLEPEDLVNKNESSTCINSNSLCSAKEIIGKTKDNCIYTSELKEHLFLKKVNNSIHSETVTEFSKSLQLSRKAMKNSKCTQEKPNVDNKHNVEVTNCQKLTVETPHSEFKAVTSATELKCIKSEISDKMHIYDTHYKIKSSSFTDKSEKVLCADTLQKKVDHETEMKPYTNKSFHNMVSEEYKINKLIKSETICEETPMDLSTTTRNRENKSKLLKFPKQELLDDFTNKCEMSISNSDVKKEDRESPENENFNCENNEYKKNESKKVSKEFSNFTNSESCKQVHPIKDVSDSSTLGNVSESKTHSTDATFSTCEKSLLSKPEDKTSVKDVVEQNRQTVIFEIKNNKLIANKSTDDKPLIVLNKIDSLGNDNPKNICSSSLQNLEKQDTDEHNELNSEKNIIIHPVTSDKISQNSLKGDSEIDSALSDNKSCNLKLEQINDIKTVDDSKVTNSDDITKEQVKHENCQSAESKNLDAEVIKLDAEGGKTQQEETNVTKECISPQSSEKLLQSEKEEVAEDTQVEHEQSMKHQNDTLLKSNLVEEQETADNKLNEQESHEKSDIEKTDDSSSISKDENVKEKMAVTDSINFHESKDENLDETIDVGTTNEKSNDVKEIHENEANIKSNETEVNIKSNESGVSEEKIEQNLPCLKSQRKLLHSSVTIKTNHISESELHTNNLPSKPSEINSIFKDDEVLTSFVIDSICFETKLKYLLNKEILNNKVCKTKIDENFDLQPQIDENTLESMKGNSTKKRDRSKQKKSKTKSKLKNKCSAANKKGKSCEKGAPNVKELASVSQPANKTVSPNHKMQVQSSNENSKGNFSLPDGFLEIIGSTGGGNVMSGRGRGKSRNKGRNCQDTNDNILPENDTDENLSTPVKRSRRIQEQQQKKMTQLAEEMEKEQRRLEALAKESAAVNKVKQKEIVHPEAKLQSNHDLDHKQLLCSELKSSVTRGRGRPRSSLKHPLIYEDESKDSDFEMSKDSDRGKRKKGHHRKRRGHKPWDISSESSTPSEDALTEEEEEEEEEYEREEQFFFDPNEDEFACEELDEDIEPIILRRARTAKKVKSASESESEDTASDDKPCGACGKYDRPEWILLCDKCDSGYHTECLHPPLMFIPDGDWYCPPCEHNSLCDRLFQELQKLDQLLKQKEREELRKQRLAYVGISLDNVLKPEKKEKFYETYEDSDDSLMKESEEEKICKIYSKRSSRTRKTVNYQFKEFDELIASAIQEEVLEAEIPLKSADAEITNPENEIHEIFTGQLSKRKKRGHRLNDLEVSDEDDSDDEYQDSSFSGTEITPSANSEDFEQDSCSSNSWKGRKMKPSKKIKSKKRGRGSDDWESDGSDAYRHSTRRAAQKRISYRELSSEEEWTEEKITAKKKSQKRKKSSSSSSYESESDRKSKKSTSKKKARIVNRWTDSETESEKSDSSGESSESSSKSSGKCKQKEKFRDYNGVASNKNKSFERSESDSSSKEDQKTPRKRIVNRLVDSDDSENSTGTNEKVVSQESSGESSEENEVEETPLKKITKMVPSYSSITETVKKPQANQHAEKKTEESKKISILGKPVDSPKSITYDEILTKSMQIRMEHVTSEGICEDKSDSESKTFDNSSVSQPFSNEGADSAHTVSLPNPRRIPVQKTCESDSEPEHKICKFQDDQFLCKREQFQKETEYRPAKESQNFDYHPSGEKRFQNPYSDLTPLEDYPSRPSPLKPSLVETYPSNSSPSKLTPLDSYSQANSPKGLISLDSYTPSKKKKHYSTPNNCESEIGSRHLPPSTDHYQGEIRFAQEQYQCYMRSPHHSPTSCQSSAGSYSRSPTSTPRRNVSPPRMYTQYPESYVAPRSPEYYNNHDYYSAQTEEASSRPNYQPGYSSPAEHAPPYNYGPNPGQQSNGGFMIDTILRSRNPETEEDDLTGVTDIVSYITQE